MRKVYVKWMSDLEGTVKGGKYDGCLVKVTTSVPSIPYTVAILINDWIILGGADTLGELREYLEEWLNN